MEKDWTKIKDYTDAMQAEIYRQMLVENGISAVLMNKQDSSYHFGKIELYVNHAEEQQALALLNLAEENEN